nr:hypothetical protein LGRDSM20601_p0059 [Listeria grayi]CBV37300.1 hypothetical protein LGRDSM20601_p0075 [Listeria grayi]
MAVKLRGVIFLDKTNVENVFSSRETETCIVA